MNKKQCRAIALTAARDHIGPDWREASASEAEQAIFDIAKREAKGYPVRDWVDFTYPPEGEGDGSPNQARLFRQEWNKRIREERKWSQK